MIPAAVVPRKVAELLRPSTMGAMAGAMPTMRCCCGTSMPQPHAPHSMIAGIAVQRLLPVHGSRMKSARTKDEHDDEHLAIADGVDEPTNHQI